MSHVCHSFHIIFSTKERIPLIHKSFQADLYQYIGGIIRNAKGKLIEIGGVEDHIHILAHLHQSISHSDVIRDIKSGSSRWVNEHKHCPHYFSWQEKYGSFSVSRSVEPDVIAYIRKQEMHHKTVTYQDEFRAFLKRHEQEFDEKYIWQ